MKKLIDTNLPPLVTCIVADAVTASSCDSSMAVQDTSVPFRSDIGSGAVSVDDSSEPGPAIDVILNDVPLIISICPLDLRGTSLVLLILSPDSITSVTFHSMKLRFVVHMKTNESSPGHTDTSPDGDKITSSVGFKCMHIDQLCYLICYSPCTVFYLNQSLLEG